MKKYSTLELDIFYSNKKHSVSDNIEFFKQILAIDAEQKKQRQKKLHR